MQRYNIFSQVHKGLRALLYHTANTLQQTDFGNAHEADPVMKQVTDAMDLFDRHAISEDNFIHPAIERFEPGVTALFREKHREQQVLGNRIRTLVQMFIHNFSTEERVLLGGAVRFAFVEFLTARLEQMAKEEDVLNNLLWANYSDEELRATTRQIVAQMAPAEMGKFCRWMLHGLNNSEIIAWLKEVRNNATGCVFNDLLSAAANELPESRWMVIKESLVDGAMVA